MQVRRIRLPAQRVAKSAAHAIVSHRVLLWETYYTERESFYVPWAKLCIQPMSDPTAQLVWGSICGRGRTPRVGDPGIPSEDCRKKNLVWSG